MSIRAVLFDIGGVLVESPLRSFEAYEAANGIRAGFVSALVARGDDTCAWARHERGEIDTATFAELFAAEASAAGHAVDALRLLGGIGAGPLQEPMVAALLRARAHGLLVGLLTNNFPGADGDGTLLRADLAAIVGLADIVVESCREGVRKPDPRFYLIACERLGIQPQEAVFLDDLGVNLKAARALGIRTIKVSDVEAAVAELEEVLGIPLRGEPAPDPPSFPTRA